MLKVLSDILLAVDSGDFGCSDIIGPIGSIRYGRSWNSSASTQGVIRP